MMNDEIYQREQAAQQQVAALREALESWVTQHGCTCGHPAHKLDRETQFANDLLTLTPTPAPETELVVADWLEGSPSFFPAVDAPTNEPPETDKVCPCIEALKLSMCLYCKSRGMHVKCATPGCVDGRIQEGTTP